MELAYFFLRLIQQGRLRVCIRVKDTDLYLGCQDRLFLRQGSQKSGYYASPLFLSKYKYAFTMDNCGGPVCSEIESKMRYSLFTMSKDFMWYFPYNSMITAGYGVSDPLSYPIWIATGRNQFKVKDFERDLYLCAKGNKLYLGPPEEACELTIEPVKKWPGNFSLMFAT